MYTHNISASYARLHVGGSSCSSSCLGEAKASHQDIITLFPSKALSRQTSETNQQKNRDLLVLWDQTSLSCRHNCHKVISPCIPWDVLRLLSPVDIVLRPNVPRDCVVQHVNQFAKQHLHTRRAMKHRFLHIRQLRHGK